MLHSAYYSYTHALLTTLRHLRTAAHEVWHQLLTRLAAEGALSCDSDLLHSYFGSCSSAAIMEGQKPCNEHVTQSCSKSKHPDANAGFSTAACAARRRLPSHGLQQITLQLYPH